VLQNFLCSTVQLYSKFIEFIWQQKNKYLQPGLVGTRKYHSSILNFSWPPGWLEVSIQDQKINISEQVDHEGESLEQAQGFKFLGSYKSADGDCTKEIKRRIALARQKAVVLASIWKDWNIKTATKVKVMKSMVRAVFQYGVEGWTLKKSDRNWIEGFEMWRWRKMLSISWQKHRTNDSILTELGLERELMGRVAKLKLQYFGHTTRGSAGQLALTVLEWIMASRQTEKTVDTAKGDITRSSTMEKKAIGVVVCCRQPSSRKVNQWVSDYM